MSYVPLERLIDKSHGSMFKLVMLASKRALELAEGSSKLVEAPQDTKITTLAMLEIAEDKVELGAPKAEAK
ncbi:DNA-directed RNA polymerase subunit omega [Candidatus Velamenicoccus archaeovorus]|uniref:DNA-directed RNA polymerase subunit omega n=1 Tax=Velamenicoccus archaeovorus TaxID=1930593 RepID=A0A410P7F6_VELA1|nr:DNA-directed RNA polymerase subunit omega [Candidatus Velamenicoccus archaeovorus]QAT17941.1 DNA-directed RNA polymerase subunit omega [Candidatus Velamenicoccus archaeovorus]